MGTGSDYAELCELAPSSRWSSRSGVGGGIYQQQHHHHQQQPLPPPPPTHVPYHHHSSSSGGGGHPSSSLSSSAQHHHSSHHQVTSSGSVGHVRSNSFEAEDIVGPYGVNSRIGNSTSSLRGGRSGLYYSPPGTSYTIVERPHSPSYYYNATTGTTNTSTIATSNAGVNLGKGNSHSLPGRGTYLGSSSVLATSGGTGPSSSRLNNNGGGGSSSSGSTSNKKRPISPEQVIGSLFSSRAAAGVSSSASVPTSSQQYYSSNGGRERGRRSPASSPPSTTHQLYRERDRSIPNIHELSTRTVTMSRDQQQDSSHGFGICVKGGRDSGVGVYISRIEEGSVAERAGLRPGDTILEVNGTPFTAISHDEALKKCVQILKSSRQISMTVRSPPGLMMNAPSMHSGSTTINRETYPPPYRQTCSWMDRHGRPASPPMEYGGRRHDRRDRIRRVELLIEPGQSLGLMIRGGVEYGLGIFITGVDKESVADRAGLMIGDQILEVNGQSFLEVTHDEAVSQLKYHKRMSLVVRDVGKVPHSCTTVEPEPWDPYSPTGTRSRRKCPVSAMVEEKARSLLPRHHFASLSYYIAEYSGRGMTIDAFVAVLLEMLDTPEKHTLVTEIRELVFPEDRTRYDELVYRRDRENFRDSLDRHRPKITLTNTNQANSNNARKFVSNPNDEQQSHDMAVSELDLEVTEATGKSPSEDSGLGMGVSDIRQRPPLPLPYRPLSAGPVLHHHSHHHLYHPASTTSSHRFTTGSHNNLADIQRNTLRPPGTGSISAIPQHMQQHQRQPKVGTGGGGGNGPATSSSLYGNGIDNQDYNCDDPTRLRRGSETHISRTEDDSDQGGYLEGIRSQLGGLTQRVKSWYWGRPLELATKLSRSFDMKEEGGALLGDKSVRRHQSMQRLSLDQNGDHHMHHHHLHGGGGGGQGGGARGDGHHHGGGAHNSENSASVVPDHRGNLHITVKKSKPILGIAIEGGANTKHPLPRIINIHEHGAAFDAGGLEVGQLILEVDGHNVDGMHHQEVARLIAECYASREKPDITFLVVEAKKSNMEPKPTALIFLEA